MTSRHVTILPFTLLLMLSGCGGGGSSDPGAGPDIDGSGGTGGTDAGTGTGADTAGDGSTNTDGASSANGIRLVEIATTRADGQVRTETFGWDDDGRLLTETIAEGGSVVESRVYDWPDASAFISRADDIGDDGNVDRFVDYSFTPDGRLGSARIDAADGSLIGSLEYTVGNDGNVESLERSEGGVLLRRETFSYSTGGELESSAIDSDGDGSVDTILGYEYAENGSVASTIATEASPGSGGEQTAVWTYERGECIRGWFNSVFKPYCVTFR